MPEHININGISTPGDINYAGRRSPCRNGSRKLSTAAVIVAALLAAGFGLVFWLVPSYADDLWYGLRNAHYIRGLVPDVDWQGVAETIQEHFATDNARLPNVIMSVAVIMPKWICALISTLLWFYAIRKIFSLAGIGKGKGLLPVALGVFFISFLLPWFEAFGALAYQLAYIWGTAIVMWCMGRFVGEHDKVNRSKRQAALCFAAGLLLGVWHEGFSVTFMAFGAMITVLDRHRYLNKRNVLMLAGCFIGTLYLFILSPAMDRADGLHEGLSASKLMITALGEPAFMLLCLVWLILLCFRATRPRLKEASKRQALIFAISLTAGAAVNFMIHLLSVNSPRAGWCGQIFSIIAIIVLIGIAFPTRYNPGRQKGITVKAVAACLLLAISFLRLGASDFYAIKLHNEFPRVIAEAGASPVHQAFTDFPTEFDAPLICAFFPDFTFYTAEANRKFMMHFYDFEDEGFAVVPSKLAQTALNAGQAIESDRQIRLFGPYLFTAVENMPEITGQAGEFTADVSFGPLTRRGQRVLYYRYTSRADGNDYYWLYPWRSVPFCLLSAPRSVRNIDFHQKTAQN